MNWKTRIPTRVNIALLIIGTIPFVCVVIYAALIAQKTALDTGARYSERQAMVISTFLNTMLDDAVNELDILADTPQFTAFIKNRSASAMADLKQRFTKSMKRHPEYVQLRYLDAAGQEQLRIDRREHDLVWTPDNLLQDKSTRYYFQESYQLQAGEAYLSPLDLNIEFGKVVVPYEFVTRVAIPVFSNDQHAGILIINFDGAYLLDRALVPPPGANAFMVNEDGFFISKTAGGYSFGQKTDFLHEKGIELTPFMAETPLQLAEVPGGFLSSYPVMIPRFTPARVWHTVFYHPERELIVSLPEYVLSFLPIAVAGFLFAGFSMIAFVTVLKKRCQNGQQ